MNITSSNSAVGCKLHLLYYAALFSRTHLVFRQYIPRPNKLEKSCSKLTGFYNNIFEGGNLDSNTGPPKHATVCEYVVIRGIAPSECSGYKYTLS